MNMMGGYESIVQIQAGQTTLIDCTLSCSAGGSCVWIKDTGSLVLHNCKLSGSCGSAIQVKKMMPWPNHKVSTFNLLLFSHLAGGCRHPSGDVWL